MAFSDCCRIMLWPCWFSGGCIAEELNAKYHSCNFLARRRCSGMLVPWRQAAKKGKAIMGEWTLLSNHGHVLVCLARNPEARLRDVAADVGITERAVQNILRELQQAGMVVINKHGRCNHYQINPRKSLRHPLEAHCTVGNLLQLLKVVEVEAEKPPGAGEENAPAAKPAVSRPTTPKPRVAKSPVAKSATPAATAKTEPVPEAKDSKPQRKGKSKADEPTPSSQQGSLF
jgi:hypothetical protein